MVVLIDEAVFVDGGVFAGTGFGIASFVRCCFVSTAAREGCGFLATSAYEALPVASFCIINFLFCICTRDTVVDGLPAMTATLLLPIVGH